VLDRLKRRIDRETGRALLEDAERASTSGLVGVSSTTLPTVATVPSGQQVGAALPTVPMRMNIVGSASPATNTAHQSALSSELAPRQRLSSGA
jgi:hypothetical protein